MNRIAFGPALLLGFAAALSGGTAPAETVAVRIDKGAFEPAVITIKPGDTVVWLNTEKRTSHDVVFEDGVRSERLMPDDVFERRFDTAGRHSYRCTPHPRMTGEVVVEP
ncbi:cupredoxin domain-containing protein [Azospirillum agricola]|uniref:cupredoxin domain-containing protein n=1 Tax=Azospirillum agricola TaxID=1720247 RepID=UPI000A0F12D8|nr:plastocyanin/azurin family copper-binding protein [Azospirillum agricola]SMH45667.1 Plastocyanin [Azospirillum lipoferum]